MSADIKSERANSTENCAPVRDFVIFHSCGHKWALEASYVTSIKKEVLVTPLPGSDTHVVGLIDLLGTIIPVFSLSGLLGINAETLRGGLSDLVIIGEEQAEFALKFTETSEFASVPVDVIAHGATEEFPEPSWVIGNLKDGTKILEGRTILDDRRFTVEY